MKLKLFLVFLSAFLPLFCAEADFEQAVANTIQINPYLSVENPPCAIAFSGTPGMGKTTLAKAIQDRFKGVRVSSDVIRESANPDEVIEPLIKQLMKVSKNRFVIFDSSIDRKHKQFFKTIDGLKMPCIVVRLTTPRPIVEQQILTSKKSPERYLHFLDKWYSDYTLFGEEGHWDLEFDPSVESIESVLDRIEQIAFPFSKTENVS